LQIYMIQLNPQYEAIFDSRNIDEDCDKIADEINDVARMQIKEIDDMYSSEYSLQWIYEDIIKSFIHRYKTTK
jgi:hypothetical protein